MPSLSCNVTNCYYNKSEACCRDTISVEGMHATTPNSTACGSFREEAKGRDTATNSCKCDSTPHQSLQINCEAHNCCHNENSVCRANHVSIGGHEACHYSETECDSFDCEG